MTSQRLLLWDFDGTLADTLPLALDLWNRFALRRGFEPVRDVTAARHMTMVQFLKAHRIPARQIPAVFPEFLRTVRSSIRHAPLFSGIPDVLRQLRAGGWRHAIVSSNAPSVIHDCLQHNSASDLFETVIGTSRLFGKGHRIRQTIRKLGARSAECLYIGDELRDVEAAREADVRVGCVSWGLNTAELLTTVSPEFIAHEPADLIGLIENL